MAIKTNRTYNGTVTGGSMFESVVKGTKGYQVVLSCEDGETDFIIWLTEKTREQALGYFEALGVTIDRLRNPVYVEHQMGLDIEGREIAFGTKTEYYKGDEKIKVSWIGARRSGSSGGLANSVASFFGGEPVAATPASPGSAQDDDIPF